MSSTSIDVGTTTGSEPKRSRERALQPRAGNGAARTYERVGSLAVHWSDVSDKLGKPVGAYNKGVGVLENRVLGTARKFVDLKAAMPDDGDLLSLDRLETAPRAVEAAAPVVLLPAANG